MNSQQVKKLKLPDKPGVYFFQKGKDIFYIGKATSLRDRVRSYFPSTTLGTGRLLDSRGPMILDMVTLATGIKWQETDSVLEALILEANLIKKYQPKYNTKEKDNKSFNYVCITNEKIPKVLIVRGRNISDSGEKKFFSGQGTCGAEALSDHSKNLFFSAVFGPFPNGQQLKEAMKIIRRLFPYIDNQSSKKNNFEFYKQLGLVPGVKSIPQKNAFEKVLGRGGREPVPDHFQKHFSASLLEYKKNIKNLKLFFEGKKKKIISNLKKEMIDYAKKREFEMAGEIKKKIFALEHINDVALIKEDITEVSQHHANFSRFTPKGMKHELLHVSSGPEGNHLYERERIDDKGNYATQNFYIPTSLRVEAYDIAHMSGQNMVGVMTVMENGEINKNEYRKFIIKTKNKADDTGALEEVLSRRFRHLEWRQPNLIVVDGGVAQINAAKNFIKKSISQENTFSQVLGRGGREPGPDHSKKHFSAIYNKFSHNFAEIKIVSVLKDEKHKAKVIIGDEEIIKKYKKQILLANSEAHRFAITFHKNRRNKNFIK